MTVRRMMTVRRTNRTEIYRTHGDVYSFYFMAVQRLSWYAQWRTLLFQGHKFFDVIKSSNCVQVNKIFQLTSREGVDIFPFPPCRDDIDTFVTQFLNIKIV